MKLTRTGTAALAAAGGTGAFLIAALAIAAGDNPASTDDLQRRLETNPPATAEELADLAERLPTDAPAAPAAPAAMVVTLVPGPPGPAGAPGPPGAPGPAGARVTTTFVPAPSAAATATAAPTAAPTRTPTRVPARKPPTPTAPTTLAPCSLAAYLAGACVDPR